MTFELGVEFLSLSAAIAAAIHLVRSFLPRKLTRSAVFLRLLPLVPAILGLVGGYFVFSPDLAGVALGLLAGTFSGQSHKVLKQSIKGE